MYVTYREIISVGHSCFAVGFVSLSRWVLPDIKGFTHERRRHKMAEYTSSHKDFPSHFHAKKT